MSSQTKSQANAASIAALEVSITAANSLFKSYTDALILSTEQLGKFSIAVNSLPGMSLSDIVNYYNGLGYQVTVSDALPPQIQPAALFGQSYLDYFANRQVCVITIPRLITIGWN